MAVTPEHRMGLIMIAISTLAWSTAGLFTRALHQDLLTVIVWRGIFGALGLLIVLLALQGPQGLRDFARLGWWGWFYALLSGVGMLCYIAALRETSIAHVAIIYAVVPFLTAGLSWAILAERPTRDSVIASVVAFLGAVLMVGLSRDGTPLGDLLALIMTFGMALMVVIARRHPEIPTMPAGIASGALSVLICLPFVSTTIPAPDQLLLLAGFGIINSTLGFALFLIGSTRIPPIQTALLGAMGASNAPLWVWLFFRETPGLATLAGGMVVFVAVFWHIARQSRRS